MSDPISSLYDDLIAIGVNYKAPPANCSFKMIGLSWTIGSYLQSWPVTISSNFRWLLVGDRYKQSTDRGLTISRKLWVIFGLITFLHASRSIQTRKRSNLGQNKTTDDQMSGWPSGLRRQTQARASRSRAEISGPRMWAWVRIPLLTMFYPYHWWNGDHWPFISHFLLPGTLGFCFWLISSAFYRHYQIMPHLVNKHR